MDSIVNFAIYEDSVDLLGTAEVSLPDLESKVVTYSGAGIGGDIEDVIPGHYSAMTTTIKFKSMTGEALSLSEHRWHNIELRPAIQTDDALLGEKKIVAVKHILRLMPKKIGGGVVAPASSASVSGDYATSYWKTVEDGKVVREIDPKAMIAYINGRDYLEPVRAAMGK